MTINVQPGDILVIRDTNITSKLIRLRDWILRRPKSKRRHNHVAIVSHYDAAGTLWVIEGKPSSVGYVTADKYLKSKELLTTAEQPKTAEQRRIIVETAELVNAKSGDYDWPVIAELGADCLRVLGIWKFPRLVPDWTEDEIPVHVICSSLGDLGHERAGVPSPGGTVGTRFTTPYDWSVWIQERGWEA